MKWENKKRAIDWLVVNRIGLCLLKIMKKNIGRKSIENDFTLVINNNNFLPSIKYIVTINRLEAVILKAYHLWKFKYNKV